MWPPLNQRDAAAAVGPVLFAYDGSELAAFAIAQAAAQLAPRRDALVVCVWQPVDVGFTPTDAETLRRRPGHRGTASRRADRRPRGITGRDGRIPGAQHGRRGGADLEGHRRDCRRTRRQSDRARTAPPQRTAGTPTGQCRGRGRRTLPPLLSSSSPSRPPTVSVRRSTYEQPRQRPPAELALMRHITRRYSPRGASSPPEAVDVYRVTRSSLRHRVCRGRQYELNARHLDRTD